MIDNSPPVRIAVPADFDDDEDFDLLGHFRGPARSALVAALDTDVSETDLRAHAYDVAVDAVTPSDDGIEVGYTVRYDAYYGCQDLNHVGEEERVAIGRRKGGYWVFPPPREHEQRTTLDEL